jgi:hypothetical protein
MTVRVNGQAASAVTATAGDKTYTSDSQGRVTLDVASGTAVAFSRADAFSTEATVTDVAVVPLVLRRYGVTEDLVDQLLYDSTLGGGRSPLRLLRGRADFTPDSAIAASPTALRVLKEAVAYVGQYTPAMSVTDPGVPANASFGASINAPRVGAEGNAVGIAVMSISDNVLTGCQVYFKELRWAADPATARHEVAHCAGLGHGPMGGLMYAQSAGGTTVTFSPAEEYLLQQAYGYLSPGFTYLFRTLARSGTSVRSGVRTIVIVD